MHTRGSQDRVQNKPRLMLILYWLTLSCLLVLSIPLSAQDCQPAIDCYTPDSVYYKPFSYRLLPCSDSVEARIPIYLWVDDYATYYAIGVRILCGAKFDSIITYPIGTCNYWAPTTNITAGGDSCSSFCWCGHYITPAAGIGEELVLHCGKGDTVSIVGLVPISAFLGGGIGSWQPLYRRLDTTFVAPSDIAVAPGDANCSRVVSISDAVFLINYIFAGGCAPCDPNSADVNRSCTVTISDAVYLINYIFAGGNPPLPGCVSP